MNTKLPAKKKDAVELTRIARLSVGAVFKFVVGEGDNTQTQLWKITGRPTVMGTKPDGRKQFGVLCLYVQANKADQATHPNKLFNIDFEVEALRSGSKDFDAIDRRDQPGDPVPLSRLARQQGYEDEEILDDSRVEDE